MEEKQPNFTTTLNEDEDDHYFDAFEDFPFYDCTSNSESTEQQNSTEISNIYQLNFSMQERADILIKPQITTQSDEISSNEREGMIKTHVKPSEASKEEIFTQNLGEIEGPSLSSSSFLVILAGLVVKAIGFQVSLLISFISFPIWISYCFVMLIIDPCKTLKQAKRRMWEKLYRVWSLFGETFAPFLFEKMKGQKSIARLVKKFGWGFVWSIHICVVLFGLLVSGFLIGGLVMRCLVEEPMQLVESLNFDYTRTSPVALVPILSCPSVKYQDSVQKNVARFCVLQPNHKLQLTVLLTMPESDYNRKLGIFQVRVDFLSENGHVTASSRHPCMLQFKSHFIRYLEIFLKSVPLLAGYSSEAQVLKIRMRGFSEGYKPTSCIRVILEQRAEYRSGAGIPEIYDSSLLLESELPLMKRILWNWKRTIFIWVSMVSFTMELMLVLLCCRPILIPGVRPGRSSTSNTPQTPVSPVESSCMVAAKTSGG